MKIMSINCGSSSLKFSLFDMHKNEVLASGLFERIGIEGSCYTIKYNGNKLKEEVVMENHTDAVNILIEKLISLEIIQSLEEIDGVGHRVVHGGMKYKESALVDDKVIEYIESIKDFAPLHNPAHILGIKAFKEVLPKVPMVVVFDTAFHQTMDEKSYLYAVPYEWYENYGVRKYGFHGTSHRYITKKISEELGRNDLKIISCHLGNGGSVTAIKDGKCVDTSMGFTPLAGIVMGTRSGDVDPSIIPYVMEKAGLNASEVVDALNKKSGYLGLSGKYTDSRDIEDGYKAGDKRCILTQEKFVKSVVAYIANYYVLLGGADVICFAGGIGENAIDARMMIVEKLACLGIKLDVEKNNVRGKFQKISTDDSTTALYVVPTDEELMIAMDTVALINR